MAKTITQPAGLHWAWIDLENPTPEELQELADEYELPPSAVKDCLQPEHLPKFDEINEAEIEFLVQKGKPLDKAGAYAVQEQAALFIEKIEGDYWNVVGLPVNLVYSLVKAANKKG